jgi:hypothetical protein
MRIWEAQKDNWLFRIEEDLSSIGFYLRGYEEGADAFDYLQDSAELCMSFANEKFNLPLDVWRLIQE